MNIRQSFMLAAILAAANALSIDVTLAPAGDIRFGDGNEHVFRTLVALPGWQGLSSKGCWEIKKPGVAPFSLANGTNVLIKAEARLEQLPEGKVKIAYSFTPVEDVRLVVLSNRGLGPVHPEPLTRFECDAAAAGDSIARYALAVLAKGRVPRPPVISPHYVFGGTFPY